jgi:NitT/TauT family transport system ATP-binding protein
MTSQALTQEVAASGGASLTETSVWFPTPAGGGNRLVLDNVNLTIEPGEFVCLIGPSGCGKTTILNLFAGFAKPSAGKVIVGGAAVARPGPDRPVVFQNQTLFPWLRVLDNVVLGSKKRGEAKSEYLPQARKLLSQFGLEPFERYYPHQISGGMQQRVQIARALMGSPHLLLMDEPFGALDSQTRLTMQEHLIARRAAIRCSVLFITHDVDEAIFLGDRVCVMSPAPGKIALERKVVLPSRTYEVLGSEEFGVLKKDILKELHDAYRGREAP